MARNEATMIAAITATSRRVPGRWRCGPNPILTAAPASCCRLMLRAAQGCSPLVAARCSSFTRNCWMRISRAASPEQITSLACIDRILIAPADPGEIFLASLTPCNTLGNLACAYPLSCLSASCVRNIRTSPLLAQGTLLTARARHCNVREQAGTRGQDNQQYARFCHALSSKKLPDTRSDNRHAIEQTALPMFT